MSLMHQFVERFTRIRLSPIQATLVSFVVASGATLVLLVAFVGYLDTLGLYLLLGCSGLGFVVATSRYPQLGIYMLVVTVFSNLSSVLSDNGLPGVNKPLIALVLLSVVVNNLMQGSFDMKLKSVEWWMLAYGAVFLASFFNAANRDDAFSMIVDFAKEFIIVVSFAYALKSYTQWKRAIWLVILTMTLLTVLTGYQILSGDYDQTFWGLATIKRDQVITNVWQMRLNGPIYDPNFFGQILVAAIPLIVYRIIDETSWVLKGFCVFSALLNVLANLNTYSRGSFLVMVLLLFFIAVERKVNASLIVLVIFSVMLTLPFLPKGYTERLETLKIFSSDKDSSEIYKESSFRGRSSEMLSGFHMFLDHPFFGVGIGNYETRYHEYASRIGLETRTEVRQAHSLYVETAAETGLSGLITFSGLFGSLFLGMGRAKRLLKSWAEYAHLSVWVTSLQFAILGYLLNSIFLHGDFWRYLWVLVALGVTIIHLTDRHEQQGLMYAVQT